MDAKETAALLKHVSHKKILVVGDVILDLYIRGEVERISPEAPVPVVVEQSRRFILGGAGNVAANVAALGGKTTLLGAVGGDAEGKIVRALCRARGISARFVTERERPTSLKTRAVARRHQILRVDRESTHAISSKTEKKLLRIIRALPAQDMVIVSDYAKGVLTRTIVKMLVRRFGGRRMIGGLKPSTAGLYRGFSVLVLNLREAAELTEIHAKMNEDATRLVRRLGKKMRASIVLTRGEHGMTVYDATRRNILHVRSQALNIFDVTGAGDTVIAVLGLMRAGGSGLFTAANIANHAAGVVVGKEGTETASPKELIRHIVLNEGN